MVAKSLHSQLHCPVPAVAKPVRAPIISMNPTHLIDDNGVLVRLAAAQRRLISAGDEAVDFSLRSLGYIAITELPSTCLIRICPHHLSEVSLATLAYFLAENPAKRIALSWFDSVWRDEIFGSPRLAIQRLVHLANMAATSDGQAYISRRRNLASLPASHRLQTVYELWRTEQFDRQKFTSVLNEKAEGRYILAGLGARPGSLVFQDVGRGVVFYGEDWQSRTRGHRVQDQPDYDLGLWVSEAYLDTLVSNEPRLEDTDIVVRRPRNGSIRITYTRLLLPLAVAGKRSGILSVSHLDPGIDLRFNFKKISENIVD